MSGSPLWGLPPEGHPLNFQHQSSSRPDHESGDNTQIHKETIHLIIVNLLIYSTFTGQALCMYTLVLASLKVVYSGGSMFG